MTPKPAAQDCIEAHGSLTTHGYGRIKIAQKEYGAHRISYMLFKGYIKPSLQVDHLCRNRKCINPDHLRLVTSRENTLCGNGITAKQSKQTHCKWGHPFTVENTQTDKSRPRHRNCKTCLTLRNNGKHPRQQEALS